MTTTTTTTTTTGSSMATATTSTTTTTTTTPLRRLLHCDAAAILIPSSIANCISIPLHLAFGVVSLGVALISIQSGF